MRRAIWRLKIGSLALYSSPLRVGLANELREEVLRHKNSWDVLGKGREWPVVVGLYQAFSKVAKHHDPQHASGVDQMAAEILFDFELGLALPGDRRSPLHEIATGLLPDGVGERKLAVDPNFSLDLLVAVG